MQVLSEGSSHQKYFPREKGSEWSVANPRTEMGDGRRDPLGSNGARAQWYVDTKKKAVEDGAGVAEVTQWQPSRGSKRGDRFGRGKGRDGGNDVAKAKIEKLRETKTKRRE